jgi:nuclear pore complex protein Nup155
MIKMAHDSVAARPPNDQEGKFALPFEAVLDQVKRMADQLSLSEILFPIEVVIPMVERYSFEYQRDVGPKTWVVDLFIDVGIPHANILSVLEAMFYNDEAPFQGNNRKIIGSEMFTVIKKWYAFCRSSNQSSFGGADAANGVIEMLTVLQQNQGFRDRREAEDAEILRLKVVREYQW